jgi:ubiquinone/menaquinone biosynthesis C-methylase UbiE
MDNILQKQRERHDSIKVLKDTLSLRLSQDRRANFGNVKGTWIKYAEEYFWDESQQDFRLLDLLSHGFLPGKSDILDVAAGCGQFLFRALEAGYNCYGIEPEHWKLDFIREKNKVLNRPSEWADKVGCGVGENMPFPDNSFDCVTSYQTLEHVQSPAKVIAEMIRVTRPGGGICLRCPDYRSTFEAHYQLPWLPLFPKPLAKRYLQLLKRPVRGLAGLQYITRPRIMGWIRRVEEGRRLVVYDENRTEFENALRRRGLQRASVAYPAYVILKSIRFLGRRESDINLFVRVLRK